VRRDENILVFQQRVPRGERFWFSDIKARTCDLSALQSNKQRVIVYKSASRGVHYENSVTHVTDQFTVYQVAGF